MPVMQTVDFAEVVYKDCESIDHKHWVKNARAYAELPLHSRNYRGYFGLALVLASTSDSAWTKLGNDRLFVPNQQMEWVTLVDAVRADGRVARWGAVRPMSIRYGMPVLGYDSSAKSWDLAFPPFDSATIFSPYGNQRLCPTAETLSPNNFPQLFRVFNQLNRAMTSAAKVDAGLVQNFFYGEHRTADLPRVETWMPRPYVAFKYDMRGQVFDHLVQVHNSSPVYPDNLLKAFTAALPLNLEYKATFSGKIHSISVVSTSHGRSINVRLSGDRGEHRVISFCGRTASLNLRANARFEAGVVIGTERIELPDNWFELGLSAQMDIAIAKNRHEPNLLRFWFEREGIDLKASFRHWPASLVGTVALTHGVDSDLSWDLGDITRYFHDKSDSVIFPPVPVNSFTGNLLDVAYDLTPWSLFKE